MISWIIAFFKSLCYIKILDEPEILEEPDALDNPKKLRIKIPKCTFIACALCKNYYIKEHSLYCTCLKKNEDSL